MCSQARRKPSVVVLIDDDPLIQTSWKIYCRQTGVTFHGFLNMNIALQAAEVLGLVRDSSTWIIVDSSLGPGQERGELGAVAFRELGFKEIWISTGYLPEEIQVPEWVSGVRGKDPWF